jgi:colanic acid biosynthesis glycosyl transferase WcaI
MLRILTLSHFYVPEPGFKIHLLAKDLSLRGHQVTSITGFPNYPHGKIYSGYRQRLWRWEQMDGVRVLRLPLYPDHSRSVVRRILNYLSFAASATALGPIFCDSADVMWVYQPPLTVGIPAVWISLLRRIPFVYEIQDMWPETLAATGMMTSTPAARLMSRLAKLIYRQAIAITVISPGFKDNLVSKGVPADKIHVIPNWADEEIYRPVPRDEALAAENGMNGRFNVVYGGNMGAAQALENVLETAALLRDLRQIQFVLIGDGIEAATLQKTARERGLDNVRFIKQQPEARMPHFFALADVLLIHLKRDPLFEITIPSKTIAYLACGRPILGTVPGDAADVVRSAHAGVSCPPEDPQAMAQVLRDLYEMPPSQRDAMGEAGRLAFLENYTRQLLVDRYEALFTQIAQQKNTTRAH